MPNSTTGQTNAYLWRCWLLLLHSAMEQCVARHSENVCVECMHRACHAVLISVRGCQPQAPTTIARRVRAVEMKRLAISPVSALTVPKPSRDGGRLRNSDPDDSSNFHAVFFQTFGCCIAHSYSSIVLAAKQVRCCCELNTDGDLTCSQSHVVSPQKTNQQIRVY
jgi:hypothetical protein